MNFNLRPSALSAVKTFCVVLLLFAASSCDKCNKPKEASEVTSPTKTVSVNPPAFNSDSAYDYTKAQVDFGPRNMNSKTHEECAKWLIEKMKTLADTVYIQKFEIKGFDGVNLKCTNIIASFNPKAATRILLTSHWDSRPWADQDKVDRDKPILSACDGASGVGTLIEMARDIKSKPIKTGVDIFFNDAEDYGYSGSLQGIVKAVGETENSFCIGSQYWSHNPHVAGYKADFGVLLDMSGGRNAVFTRDGTSSANASWVQDMVWGNGQQLGYASFFNNLNTPALTDDHAYINQIAK
ncbi:MAG: peptidase, partial [Bacteroidota bacterium]|nr:peptidase [Bacteroidota bacterium]